MNTQRFVTEPVRRRRTAAGLAAVAMVAAASLASMIQTGCAALRYTPQEAQVAPEAYTVTGDSLSVTVALARVPELAAVGGAATIIDERLSRHLLIARPGTDEYVVVSSHCTHFGRALSYEHDKRRFRCSSLSHSEFGLDGAVLGGPAEGPIMVYRTTVENDTLCVDLTACAAPGAACPCPRGAADAPSEIP